MIFKYNTVISRVFLIISNQRRKSEKYMERYEIYFNTNIISEIIKEDRVNNNFHKKKKNQYIKKQHTFVDSSRNQETRVNTFSRIHHGP